MPRDFYRYTIGNAVQLAPKTPIRQIIWRGKQGIVGRDGKAYAVPVYHLDGPHWDCYDEDELHSALRWDVSTSSSPLQPPPYS